MMMVGMKIMLWSLAFQFHFNRGLINEPGKGSGGEREREGRSEGDGVFPPRIENG